MTREEALLLEGQYDTMMSKYTGRVCELKMTFSGRLQVIFKHYDEFVILDEEMKEMSFVKFYGFYILWFLSRFCAHKRISFKVHK